MYQTKKPLYYSTVLFSILTFDQKIKNRLVLPFYLSKMRIAQRKNGSFFVFDYTNMKNEKRVVFPLRF